MGEFYSNTNGHSIQSSLKAGDINKNITNKNKKGLYEEVPGSKIQEYYKGKCILITGATGFVGKVLVERLLVTCPGIDTIYLMIREKKGHSPLSRIQKLLEGPLFTHVDGKTLSKVVPVVGDVGASMVGLSAEDYQMLSEKIHIVVHCAANVRFDTPINELIRVNVKGTCDMLDLARNMKNLISFVYVSTIYSHLRPDRLGEKLYEPGLDIDVALGLVGVNAEDEETLQILNAKILQSWPNSYSFSKGIAEYVIKVKGQGLPICVFRPGVVTSTTHEHPVPGYLDNTNGPIGVLLGVGTGIANIVICIKDKCATVLPCDYCANAIIACSWDSAGKITPEPKVYNYIPADNVGWTIEQMTMGAAYHCREQPFDKTFGYPFALFTESIILFRIVVILVYLIPGLIADAVRLFFGMAPIYVKVYRRFVKHVLLGSLFSNNVFRFELVNSALLHESMTPVDQKMFKIDFKHYEFDLDFPIVMQGIKKFILKEDEEVSKVARQKMMRHKIAFHLTMFLFFVFGIYFISCCLIFYITLFSTSPNYTFNSFK